MTDNTPTPNPLSLELLDGLLACAARHGADAADAVLFHTSEVQASCRRLRPEAIERAESAALGLRVWTGRRQAVVSSTDLSTDLFDELAERAVDMARSAPDDPDSMLAPEPLLARCPPELDLHDALEPSTEWLLERCRAAEESALAVPGITNSEGADAGYSSTNVALAARRNGHMAFAHSYASSHVSLSVSVLAGEGTAMERDYEYAGVRHAQDLLAPPDVGTKAAERALRRLHPRKVPTCRVPVVYDPRAGRSLLSHFASAINGASVARGTSFLKEAMHRPVFAPEVTIIDDPHMRRGLGSRPFDAEGVQNGRRVIVERGVLTSWLLDVRTASKLGLQTTGHAARGVASAPSPAPTNFYLQAGSISPETLISDIASGLYVIETFGMGVNLITGDYSQGAVGVWIENGTLTYPVSEITVAGNLHDMFARLTPADDLVFRYATNVPTLRIDGMTVAGQ